eukprot:TRINITY_DN99_c0_g1_i2.p1 TRINITY_DN99_c0_g1~~TRINITY_DN99_c0_g1_i2.p1  ORF type:complete len:176 (-),score=21.92 TRINITY_DN99_c0_g1_i2:374-901(-)
MFNNYKRSAINSQIVFARNICSSVAFCLIAFFAVSEMMKLFAMLVVILAATSMVQCGRKGKYYGGGVAAASSQSTASVIHGVASATTSTDTFASGNGVAIADASATAKTKNCYVHADSSSIAVVKYKCGKVIADAFGNAFAYGNYPVASVSTFAKTYKCSALSSSDSAAKAFGCY